MAKIILILPDRKNRLPSGEALKQAGFRVSTAMKQGPEPNARQESETPLPKEPAGPTGTGDDVKTLRKALAKTSERPWPA